MRDEEEDRLRDLERTQTVPMNRKTRRTLAKRAGVRFKVVNQGMMKQPPTYLGIRQFKQAAGKDKKLAQEYKDNAHRSLDEMRDRAAAERAAKVEVTEGKELTKKQMAKVIKS